MSADFFPILEWTLEFGSNWGCVYKKPLQSADLGTTRAQQPTGGPHKRFPAAAAASLRAAAAARGFEQLHAVLDT
jgi:hypothetical protein